MLHKTYLLIYIHMHTFIHTNTINMIYYKEIRSLPNCPDRTVNILVVNVTF